MRNKPKKRGRPPGPHPKENRESLTVRMHRWNKVKLKKYGPTYGRAMEQLLADREGLTLEQLLEEPKCITKNEGSTSPK